MKTIEMGGGEKKITLDWEDLIQIHEALYVRCTELAITAKSLRDKGLKADETETTDIKR